jgi:hypothetical protein
VGHLGSDELTSQRRRLLVALLFSEVALEDSIGRALSEVRFEDRGEGQPATGPPAANTVSPRHRRPER